MTLSALPVLVPLSVLFYLMYVWMLFKVAEWSRFGIRTAH